MLTETWWEFEIYGGEPAILLLICYFLNEATGKRWSKKFGARYTKQKEVQVKTSDGVTALYNGEEIRLQCVRPENIRPRD